MKIYDSAHQLQRGSYDKATASKFNFNYDSQPQKYIKLMVEGEAHNERQCENSVVCMYVRIYIHIYISQEASVVAVSHCALCQEEIEREDCVMHTGTKLQDSENFIGK